MNKELEGQVKEDSDDITSSMIEDFLSQMELLNIWTKNFIDFGILNLLISFIGRLILLLFRDTFIQATLGMEREYAAPMVAKEIENMKKGISPIQNLQRALIAREECLWDLQTSNSLIEDTLKSENFDEDGGLLIEGFEVEEEFMDTLCH